MAKRPASKPKTAAKRSSKAMSWKPRKAGTNSGNDRSQAKRRASRRRTTPNRRSAA